MKSSVFHKNEMIKFYQFQTKYFHIYFLFSRCTVSVSPWKICEAVTISYFLVYPQHLNTCGYKVEEDVNSKYAIQLQRLYIFASGYIIQQDFYNYLNTWRTLNYLNIMYIVYTPYMYMYVSEYYSRFVCILLLFPFYA